MLVENAASLPEGAEWEYQYSWPGDRVLATKEEAKVRLIGALQRRDLTNRFPVVAAAVAKLNAGMVVLDGVVRAIEPAQLALFHGATPSTPANAIRFIVSDLLSRDSLDARQLPLLLRREQLVQLVANSGILMALPLAGTPGDMLAQAARVGADGIIAKRRDSRYRPFARTGDWIRVPVQGAPGGSGAAADREGRMARFGPFGGWRPATA